MDIYRIVRLNGTTKEFWNGGESGYSSNFTTNESGAFIDHELKSLTTKIRRTNTKYNKAAAYRNQPGLVSYYGLLPEHIFDGCFIEVVEYKVLTEMPMVEI